MFLQSYMISFFGIESENKTSGCHSVNLVLVSSTAGYSQAISSLGLDKICLAKFEQNGQPKERSNSASKMGRQFCQKSKMGKE